MLNCRPAASTAQLAATSTASDYLLTEQRRLYERFLSSLSPEKTVKIFK